MQERQKIREARFFLTEMVQNDRGSEILGFYLSAFVSSSRSVMQYLRKECETAGRQQWYDQQMASSPLCCFFRDVRDTNIHDGPVAPRAAYHLTLIDRVGLSDSLTVTTKDGETTEMRADTREGRSLDVIAETGGDGGATTYWMEYVMENKGKSVSLFDACEEYLAELETIVDAAEQAGLLGVSTIP